MRIRLWAALLGMALLIGTTAACSASGATEAASGRPCVDVERELGEARKMETERAGTPAESEAAEAVARLEAELGSCDKGEAPADPETTTTTTPPPVDGEAGVEDSDGERRSLPLVDDDGTPILGDTTSDPRTPPSNPTASESKVLVTWQDAVDQLGELDWYVEAVNARKSKTGFDWADIEKWATTTDVDPRVIHVFNMGLSDQEARDAVRELVGDSADKLPIARHDTCITNTRGFGQEVVQDFVDCRQMVRVSLAPIVYNEKGEATGLRSNTGIFVDCHNIWWVPRQVVKGGPPPASSAPPPTGGPTTVPPPGVPVCPPHQPHGRWPVCKDSPDNDPANRGNVPEQVQGTAPPVTGPATPPAAPPPPEVYVPPPPPTTPPTTVTGPPVTPPPTTSPPATPPPTTAPPTTVITPPR